jgi:hypothetical protein
MTPCAAVLLILMLGASFPAWSIARSRGQATPLLLLLPLPAIAAWIALSVVGYGAQSLSNLIEPVIVLALGVVLAYVYLPIVDRTGARPAVVAALMMAALLVLAVLLRTFMPNLPE